ncbi:MAG TPA: FAD-dependent monooxygenase [Mycobacteriales bacterium]|nr:FAD-dependent monooxygenase [Mycobacteriales bacterium]
MHTGADGEPARLRTDRGDEPADLAVGADDIRSVLRTALYPEHPGPTYAGYTAWRMVVPAGGPVPAFETWGRDGSRFAALPLDRDRLYCYATATVPPGRFSADERAELADRFGTWHEPIARIVAGLDAGGVSHQDVEHLRTPLPSFHRGRTVLVGDAAHAMTPDLGQGGCMAAEDAVVLAALLDAEPVPAALATYHRAATAAHHGGGRAVPPGRAAGHGAVPRAGGGGPADGPGSRSDGGPWPRAGRGLAPARTPSVVARPGPGRTRREGGGDDRSRPR